MFSNKVLSQNNGVSENYGVYKKVQWCVWEGINYGLKTDLSESITVHVRWYSGVYVGVCDIRWYV